MKCNIQVWDATSNGRNRDQEEIMTDSNQFVRNGCAEIDEITRFVNVHFGKMPPDLLNQRAGPGTWSIAENLKHLMVVNESYFPGFEALRNKNNYKNSNLISRWFAHKMGHWILKRVKRSGDHKMKTFSIWEPVQYSKPGSVVEDFEHHQGLLKTYLEWSDAWIEKGLVIASPANGLIRYRIEDAWNIIIEHEWRHLNQAMRMKANQKQQ
ncbi:MAG: DinB family protein [Saprospiraceae bacterium]|nr:DinB family protein [Saprospiraceae bacterium]